MKRESQQNNHFKSKVTASVLAVLIALSGTVPLAGSVSAAGLDDEAVGADCNSESVSAEAEDDGSGTVISFNDGPSNYKAEVNPNNNDNKTGANSQGIFWAKATYFDYLSDSEMYNGWLYPIQAGTGHNGSHDEWFPFYGFNRDIVKPMASGWSKPLYFGNFCNVYGAFNTAHHDTNLITGSLSAGSSFSTATGSFYAPGFDYPANNSNGLKDYHISYQDLMRSTLNESGQLMTPNNQVAPYFDAQKLTDSNYARVVNSAFPFRITQKGSGQAIYSFYEFDSKNARDNVYFTWKNNNGHAEPEYVNYGGSYYGVDDGLKYFMYQTASGKGIFPFNNASGSNKGSKPSTNENLDYGFGIRIDVKFRVPQDGKWGNDDMQFQFSGDDDLWVYFTDDTTHESRLALDMGGVHKESDGRINFASKQAIVDKVYYDRKDTRNLDDIFSSSGGFKYDHTYTMSVFYMERGMLESNFRMSFSLVPAGNDFKVTEKINDADLNPGIRDDVTGLDGFKFTPMTYSDASGSDPQGMSGKEYTYNSSIGESSAVTTNDGTFILGSGESADFLKQIDTGRYVGVSQTKVGSSPLQYSTKWRYWDNVNDPDHLNCLAESETTSTTANFQLQNGSIYDYAEMQVDFENTPVVTPVSISKALTSGTSIDEFPATIRISLDGGATWLTRNLEYTASDKNNQTFTLLNGELSQNCQLKQGRTITFNGIPKGAILEVTEGGTKGFKYQGATGAGVSEIGGSKFTLDTNRGTSATIENKKDEYEGAVIKAKKRLSGSGKTISLNAKAFKFGLYKHSGYTGGQVTDDAQLIQTKYCDANGDIVFDEIKYTDPGSYFYSIRELVPDQKDPDVSDYSDAVFYVEVYVSGTGATFVSYYQDSELDEIISGSYPMFDNLIKAGEINVDNFNQSGGKAEGVKFELYKVTGDGDEASIKADNLVKSVKTDSEGKANFSDLPIYADDYRYGNSNTGTIYFVNVPNWEHVYAFAGDINDNHLLGDYPGTEMTVGEDGKYELEVPLDADYLMFNDGFGNTETEEVGNIKRNGVYTPISLTGDIWTLKEGDGETLGYNVFENTLGWNNVYIYAADSDNDSVMGDWPGTRLTELVEGTSNQYKFTVPDNTDYYIFNNGSGGAQTIDCDKEIGKKYTPNGQQDVLGQYTLSISDLGSESDLGSDDYSEDIITHNSSDYQWYALVEADPKSDPDTNQNYSHNNIIIYFQFPIEGSYTHTFEYVNKYLKIGDINFNGRIDIADCTAIQYHLAYLETLSDEQLALADVDGNGVVDIRDVTLMQKYLAGFDVEFAKNYSGL